MMHENAVLIVDLLRHEAHQLLSETVVIGRHSQSDIQSNDVFMSRRHCALYFSEGHWAIVDLGSTTGTEVNGCKIAKPIRLAHNDEIAIGTTKYRFVVPQANSDTQSAAPVAFAEVFSLQSARQKQLDLQPDLRLLSQRHYNLPLARESAHEDLTETKQRFLSMVSHDIRTPLTAIQGALSMLANVDFDQSTTKEVLALASRNIGRVMKLTGELLELEKADAGEFTVNLLPTRMESIIEQAVESVELFARNKDVLITADGTADIICADEQRLVQVLVNLLENAVKFSPAGGVVHVSAEQIGDCVEIRVVDNGRGVPSEFRTKIFDRFKQVELADASVRRGSGLGLAICKSIVELHGGTISVDETPTGGSTFWFRVPIRQSNPQHTTNHCASFIQLSSCSKAAATA